MGAGVFTIGVADAVGGAPSVFVPHQRLPPGFVEIRGRVSGRVEHGPERLGLGQPGRGGAVEAGLAGRGQGAVLPIRGEVAGDDRQARPIALLELLEHLLGRGDDDLGRFDLLVPAPHDVRQLRIGGAVVAADGVADLDHLVRIALVFELAAVFEDRLLAVGAETAVVEAVEPGIAPSGHPEEDFFLGRRGRPVEGLVAPGLEGAADAVPAIVQVGHVVGTAGEIAHAGLGQGRDKAPGIAGDVREHGRVDGQAVLPGQPPGVGRRFEQLVGRARSGQDVGQEPLEADLPFPDRG